MDAFFAAVEERSRPELRGLPIVVGADPRRGRGRGVVSTANYQAREYGIRSGMPISRAWRLSEAAAREGRPRAVFLPVDMERYARVSGQIMDILRRFAPLVEEASIDEAYFDLTFAGSFDRAEEICRKIVAAIESEEGLTASVGIGPNKLVAKIASGLRKPRGFTVVKEEEAERLLAGLPLRVIPGIGPKTEAEFATMGLRLVKDLKRFSRDKLQALLGKRGLDLYEKVRARDDAPVVEAYEIKSVGEQETFLRDTRDRKFLTRRLREMCRDVKERLEEEGFKQFRTVVLTVRFADFETKSRSRTLSAPTGSPAILEEEAMKLLEPFLDGRENTQRKLIRLIGLRLEKLV